MRAERFLKSNPGRYTKRKRASFIYLSFAFNQLSLLYNTNTLRNRDAYLSLSVQCSHTNTRSWALIWALLNVIHHTLSQKCV